MASSSKKMGPSEYDLCKKYIDKMKTKEYESISLIFMHPVDVRLFPDYLDVIKRPMDFSTLRKNLDKGMYSSLSQFFSEANLMFENCKLYHTGRKKTEHTIAYAAKMSKICRKMEKKATKWMQQQQQSSQTPTNNIKKESSSVEEKKEKISKAVGHSINLSKGNTNSTTETTTPTAPSTTTKKLTLKKRKSVDEQAQSKKQISVVKAGKSIVKSKTILKKSKIKLKPSGSITEVTDTKKSKTPTPAPAPAPIATSTSVSTSSSSSKKSKSTKKSSSPSVSSNSSSTTISNKKKSKSKTSSTSSVTSVSSSSSKNNKKTKSKKKAGDEISVSSSSSNGTNKSKKIKKSSSSSSSSKKKAGTNASAKTSHPPSRGKELPEAVVKEQKQQQQTKKEKPQQGKEVRQTSDGNSTSNNKSKSKNASTKSYSQTKTSHPPSRGKELPKAVVIEQAKKEKSKQNNSSNNSLSSSSQPTKETATSNKKSKKSSSSSSSLSKTPKKEYAPMTPEWKVQCQKVLSGLKKREHKNSGYFMETKTSMDPRFLLDYESKIPNTMDLVTIAKKLNESDEYSFVKDFVQDLRRICGNCLRYNTSPETGDIEWRISAKQLLTTLEYLLDFFLEKHLIENGSTQSKFLLYPKLLFCWKDCLTLLESLLALSEGGEVPQVAHFFLHPVSFFFHGKLPADYQEKIKKTMDFGTLTSQLVEGTHYTDDVLSSASSEHEAPLLSFIKDCKLIWENCLVYNADKDAFLVSKAKRLQSVGNEKLSSLQKKNTENKKKEILQQFQSTSHYFFSSTKPPHDLLLKLINDLKQTKYTDRMSRITENATTLFQFPVSLTEFPDYLKYVESPMDLNTIESKINSDQYKTVEDFEYDVLLIFSNCEKFNVPKGNKLILAKAKVCLKAFRKMYSSRVKTFLASVLKDFKQDNKTKQSSRTPPSSSAHGKEKGKDGSTTGTSNSTKKDKKRPSSSLTSPALPDPKTKKAKITISTSSVPTMSTNKISVSTAATSSANNTKKRISISKKISVPSSSTESAKDSNNGTSTNRARLSISSGKTPSFVISDEPLSLSVAIRQVKDSYKPRRNDKDLNDWETLCFKVLKDFMKHPWLRGLHPKFIFHAPVPLIYPQVRVAYAAKIDKPMDLSTIEGKLMQGGNYSSPQDFVDDVALVFSNGIKFNESGHSDGEPFACSVYDASRHLLRYFRWFSLEYFQGHLASDTSSTKSNNDEDNNKKHGFLSTWKLSKSYRSDSRSEMEGLVMNAPLILSDFGDKFTWMEAECEKLLKALRRQTDTRYMTFFIQTHYPPDYAAFISKPMDWEKCSSNLNERHYKNIGEIVTDLRLIFSNALKYNGRAKGTETVSGRAYDAAVYMSNKLESAIETMLLSVSDRLERDKYDKMRIEREAEADGTTVAKKEQKEQEKKVQESKRQVTKTTTKLEFIKPRKKDVDYSFYEEEVQRKEIHQGEAMHKEQKELLNEIGKQQHYQSNSQEISVVSGSAMFQLLAERSKILLKVFEKRKQNEAALVVDQKNKRAKVENAVANNGTPSTKKLDEILPNKFDSAVSKATSLLNISRDAKSKIIFTLGSSNSKKKLTSLAKKGKKKRRAILAFD